MNIVFLELLYLRENSLNAGLEGVHFLKGKKLNYTIIL
jgi:hypothetical protein